MNTWNGQQQMSQALDVATQWFNQSVDPGNPVARRGTFAPFNNGYPAWNFETSPFTAPEKVYFVNNDLVVRRPDQTEADYQVAFDPFNAGVLENYVASDIVDASRGTLPTAGPQQAINRALANNMLSVASTNYTVQPGDSARSIGLSHGSNGPQLLEVNGLSGQYLPKTPLPQGMNVVIPNTGAPQFWTQEVPIQMPNNSDNSRYTGRIVNNGNGQSSVVLVRTFPNTGAQVFYRPVNEN